jgi:hypothetical protein
MLVASTVSGVHVPLTQGQKEGVIVLTSRSFDTSIRDGSLWLVEFYGACFVRGVQMHDAN